jgi:hypothetical protein
MDRSRQPSDAVTVKRTLTAGSHNSSTHTDDATPSIVRKYNYSFLQILAFSAVWVVVLVFLFALSFVLS